MKLTVDQMLQLVHERIVVEPDSFGKKAAIRRLAQLRRNVVDMLNLEVDIPKPEMSVEAKELLKNLHPVSTQPSRRRRTPRSKGAAAGKKKPAAVESAADSGGALYRAIPTNAVTEEGSN